MLHEKCDREHRTLRDLAQVIGIAPRSLSRILSGDAPSIEHFIRLQGILGCCFCTFGDSVRVLLRQKDGRRLEGRA
jgi:transcriptional regulator with XRE-family HTH domain